MTFEEKLREEKKYSWEEGHKEGLEQGIEQGIQEGLQKKAESTARKLKAAGVDVKTIAESVGLTEAEIEAL